VHPCGCYLWCPQALIVCLEGSESDQPAPIFISPCWRQVRCIGLVIRILAMHGYGYDMDTTGMHGCGGLSLRRRWTCCHTRASQGTGADATRKTRVLEATAFVPQVRRPLPERATGSRFHAAPCVPWCVSVLVRRTVRGDSGERSRGRC